VTRRLRRKGRGPAWVMGERASSPHSAPSSNTVTNLLHFRQTMRETDTCSVASDGERSRAMATALGSRCRCRWALTTVASEPLSEASSAGTPSAGALQVLSSSIVWGAALALGCRAAPPPPPELPEPPDRAARSAQVLSLIGELRCERVEHCRALPLGAKPCGGPWRYVVFSTLTTDSARLATAAAEYSELEAEQNRRTDAVSDCRFVAAPSLSCSQGYCVSGAR
jgi:hypothetical protein